MLLVGSIQEFRNRSEVMRKAVKIELGLKARSNLRNTPNFRHASLNNRVRNDASVEKVEMINTRVKNSWYVGQQDP